MFLQMYFYPQLYYDPPPPESLKLSRRGLLLSWFSSSQRLMAANIHPAPLCAPHCAKLFIFIIFLNLHNTVLRSEYYHDLHFIYGETEA